MAAPFSTTGKTLAVLPLVGVATPFAQAAEVPFPSLSPFPNQPEPMLQGGAQDAQASGRIASPLAPLAAGMSVEASEPQFVAQVLPTAGATQTQVSVDGAGQQFDIRGGIQAGENLFHRLDQLDLEAGQVANFQTTPGLEAVFSQVGGGPSSIDGTLKVSGSSADLFLLNPNGVVFGPNAKLDLNGSFTATTADRIKVGDQWVDLLEEGLTAQTAVAGSVEALEFSADAGGGAIANQAQLVVTDGESLRLLGNAVVNTGSLTAPGGEVTVLSASGGQQVSLGGGLLNMELAAPGGSTPEHRLAPVVAQPVAEATGLSRNADGSISLQAGQTVVAGEVNLASADVAGGQAKILGDEVQVTNAVVDASGAAGGEILIGGDYQGRGDILRAVQTQLDEASALRANGISSTGDIRPDGGEVVVWSDGTAEFAGTATAQSLSSGGDGGLVETSGKQQLNIAATANVNTTSVDGATGQWLIDPVDLTVVGSGGAGGIVGGVNDSGASTIDAATVQAGLNGNNVRLQADNSITVDAPINASANASGGDLNLDSPTLNLNERIVLRSGSALSGTATTVNVGANGGIQNAVDAAVAGGTVNLASATYREGQEIIVDKGIRLQGQGVANTTISGDANGDDSGGNLADNHRILRLTGTADGTVISDITFTKGVQNNDNGGALRNDAADVTIENSAFVSNRVTDVATDGGAIHNRGENLRINSTNFEDNFAEDDGGAIDIQSGSTEIHDSIFKVNAAKGHGGAIDLDVDGSLSIINSQFENNLALTYGGAIFAGSTLEISRSNFIDNSANQSGGALFLTPTSNGSSIQDSSFVQNQAQSLNGGAIDVQVNSSLQISGSDFTQNQAQRDGGAIHNDGIITLSDTTLANNQSVDRRGGAIHLSGNGRLTIADSNFTDNQAGDHGGALSSISTDSKSLTIDNSTFVNNHSDRFGGGLYLDSTTGRIDLSDITLQNNTAQDGGGLYKLDGAVLEITGNSSIDDNSATRFGGGLVNDGVDGDVNLVGTLIRRNDAGEDGGGIHLRNGSQLTGQNLTLLNNTAQDGGAINLINSSQITLIESLFDANQAVNRGGAIDVEAGSQLNLTGGLFSNNNATTEGGAIASNGGQITVDGTEFSSNQAGSSGGAIAQMGSAITSLNNVTFTGNTADNSGGAVFNQGDVNSQLVITDSTFDSNIAQRDGGGLYLDVASGGLLSLSQSSFLNNNAVSGGGLYKTGAAELNIANTLFERNSATAHGGGIAALSSGGRITLTDSNIVQNTAAFDGGGIRLSNSNISIINSLILTNQAAFGGGLELTNSSVADVSDSLFQGNASSSDGGAIAIDNTSSAALTNSRLLNNQAGSDGGAISSFGSFDLETSLLQGNTATESGGGIHLGGTDGAVTIRSTTVNGNTASNSEGGGLAHAGSQTLTVENSTFSSNSANGNGGAFDLNPTIVRPLLQVRNSTISSNTAANSGGGFSLGSNAQLDLNNTTIANNTASVLGGGLSKQFGGSLMLQNSIVAGNTAASNPDIAGSLTSLGNNIVQNRGTSTGYVGADLPNGTDPLLLSLTDNGGLTETHAVRANSLAVDGGNAGAIAADQRGLATVNQRDIGAYEVDNDLTFAVVGSGQTQTVNQAFANPVGVTVTDSLGAVVAGLDIDVTAPVAGASASLGTLQTDSNGVASTTATANTIAGSYTVNLGITSNSSLGTVALTNRPDAPNQIAVLNGNNQSTVVNTAFANPLQVAVTDQFGNQIPFQAVAVNLPGSGASSSASNGLDLNAIALTTDVFGQATIGLTANTIAGSYPVGLTAGAITNGINLANLPDVPAQLAMTSGNNQNTVVNTTFANPLQVAVTDQFGNAISGATVNLNLPTTGASAVAGAVSLTTDAAGQANTSITANTIAGNYAVGLTSGSLSGSASLSNLPDAPAQLAVSSGDNQSTIVNTAFANPLQVAVTDQFGNAISGATVNLNLPTTGASAVAGAVSLTTDATGQASTSLAANTVAGSYTVGLTSGTLSNGINLTNLPDAPAQLSIDGGDNQSTVVNTAFADVLQVSVSDQYGNAISGATVNVNLPTSGASAAGAVSLTTDSAGQAATTITANTVAGDYLVGLTSGSLSSSAALTNRPDAPNQLTLDSGDNQSTVVNTAFSNPLQLTVIDQFGNAVPGATVNVNFPSAGASATAGSLALTTDSSGQVSTPLFANTIAGSYPVGLQVGSLSNSLNLTNWADVPAQIDLLGGDGQSTLVNTPFPDDVMVQVTDQYGNSLPGVTVTFTAPTTGASNATQSFSLQTDAAGQGQATVTANAVAGTYQLLASSGSLSQSVSLENLPEPVVPAPPVSPTPIPPDSPPTEPLLPVAPPSQIEQPVAESALDPSDEPEFSVDGSASLSLVDTGAIQELDASFSSEYSNYWGLEQRAGATIVETQELLRRADESYGVRSAVLYALFVPQDKTVDEGFGAQQAASMALTRRVQATEVRDDDQLMLVMVPAEGSPIQKLVGVNRKQALQQAGLFRMAVADPEDIWSYAPLGRQMYSWLFEPVAADAERLGLDHVMYSLAPGLRTVPLAAMMAEETFIIERYGVSVIPSVDLLETDFGASASAPNVIAAGATKFEQLDDLPAVSLELEAIATHQESVDVLLDDAFTQENVAVAQEQNQATMMHFATHAEFSPGDIQNSYLQFWDEKLTFDDVSKLGWSDLELLILSACMTAISSPEAELGFAGLAAASGVESTMGSLWHVSDLGTLALMAEFYGQLSQEPLRFEALRQAQLEMLRGKTKINNQTLITEKGDIELPVELGISGTAELSHPFYWSGFSLVGNPWW